MEPQLVFVYGTLKRPYGNSRLLEASSTLVEEGVTVDKFLLVNCGFPYMVPADMLKGPYVGQEKRVLGQVWAVHDTKTLQNLDWLEGVGSGHYRHHEVQVELVNGGHVTARAFVPCDASVCEYPLCGTIEVHGEEVYEWRR